MYKLKVVALLLFSLFFINCDKSKKDNVSKNKFEEKLPENFYAKFDECQCHKEAVRILDKGIKIRSDFNSIDKLKKDTKSKKEIKRLAITWQVLIKNCFQKNFARMFEPSDCNDLKTLEKKKRKLQDLGIQIDQGENIRL